MINITKKQFKAIKEIDRQYKELIQRSLKNYSFAKLFLIEAKRDLDVSEFLYKSKDKKFNPTMAYHLYQSIEKYCKSYALIFGAVSKKSLSSMGHNPSNAFIKILKNVGFAKILKKMKNLSKVFYEKNEAIKDILNTNFDKEAENIEELINSKEIDNISLKTIIDKFEKIRLEILIDLKRIRSDNILSLFKKPVKPFIIKIITPNYYQDIIEVSTIEYDLICFLFPLLLKLSKYANTLRYPKLTKKDQYEPEDYVKNKLEIITETPRIIDNLKNVDTRFKNFFKLVDKKNRKTTNKH